MSGNDEKSGRKKAGRVVYDDPQAPPQQSLHWERLHRHESVNGGGNNILINTHDQLISAFESDIVYLRRSKDYKENYIKVATWSSVIGYCEALATHKDAARRFAIFPIPLSSIRSLVESDFLPLLNQARAEVSKTIEGESIHRQTVRAVSNNIWKRAQNKSSSMQDELHANSLYTCLCGDVDGKSLDCFGAALLVVVGMNIMGFSRSCLTLSEDHAYESHLEEDGNSAKRATCEVAVPGNTKAAQSKRGKDISYTFEQLKRDNINAETSWLYMGANPVLCDSPSVVMAALVANLNCDIDKQKPSSDISKPQIVSGQLYKLKRDMLWVLHGAGHMTKFPFALMELGECEEHLSSKKGLEWVDASDLLKSNGTFILRNEKLFLDAIIVSKSVYGDSQVYPYLYAGHYHKDAGRDDQSEEYRLVECLRLYAEATRVSATYRYDTKDCMQLMKHMTAVAALIRKDILLIPQQNDCRMWQHRENAVAAATWLLAFFDSLLYWEEKEHNHFVEILSIQHKHSMGKLFQLFSADVRSEAIAKIYASEKTVSHGPLAVTEDQLLYFTQPRSKRLAKDSLLVIALAKNKVVVRDLDMALPSSSEGRSSRQRKKARV